MVEIAPPVKGLPLEEFLNNVAAAIKQELPGTYWVRAEILNCSKKNYWSIELCSYDNESQKAKVRGVIWSSNSDIVSKFERLTGMALKSGLKILFACSVQFHPEFGVSLNITEIDPSFTLGDMELRLNLIRQRLQDRGEINLNRNLPVPRDFLSVAVIAPVEAAGLGDFRGQIETLQRFGLCKFEYFTAQFQGNNVVESVVTAMSEVVRRYQAGSKYDALIIIRGGGDKAGLFQLNEAKIARGVCRSPIPVMVGIGHDRDTTILDEVANISFATPSLVASYIKTCVVRNSREAQLHYEKFIGASKRICYLAQQDLSLYNRHVEVQAQKQIEKSKKTLLRNKQELIYTAGSIIQKAKYSDIAVYQNLKNTSTQYVRLAGETVRTLRREITFSAQTSIQKAKVDGTYFFERLISSSGSKVNNARTKLVRLNNELSSGCNYKIFILKKAISSEHQRINAGALQTISFAENGLTKQFYSLKNYAEMNVSKSKSEITLLIERLLLQDPKKILSRGFAYIKNDCDEVLTKASDLKSGRKISIHMKDGKISALILGE